MLGRRPMNCRSEPDDRRESLGILGPQRTPANVVAQALDLEPNGALRWAAISSIEQSDSRERKGRRISGRRGLDPPRQTTRHKVPGEGQLRIATPPHTSRPGERVHSTRSLARLISKRNQVVCERSSVRTPVLGPES